MQNLLNYNELDFEEVFCLNFEITRNVFDQQKVYELIPGGKNIPVTLKNRYVGR
jgi:E3 ubiquitin-protein ligase HERC4